MRIHHLNCGTMRPLLGEPMVAHVLLVERDDGLLLVDTGFGTGDLADPRRLGQPFRAVVRPRLQPTETAAHQIAALGYDVADVRHIALTHLDLDHVGGIGDFPHAQVHVHASELAAAQSPGLSERARYVASQWAHGPDWVTHREGGDSWFGFESVTVLADDVLLVPLAGHSRGHSAVACRRPEGGWLLHAGDAYFHAGELTSARACPPTLRAFQTVVALDNKQRRANQDRLRQLHREHRHDVRIFSAHDPSELAELQAGSPAVG